MEVTTWEVQDRKSEKKNYFNWKRTSCTFVQFPVRRNFKITSVEQHAAFLKTQGLLLLKEVGSFKSNTKGRASADKKDAANVDRIISKHYLFSSFWRIRHFHCVLQQAPATPKNSDRIPRLLPTETLKPPSLIWHCRGGKVSNINQILATFLRSPLHAKQPSRGCSVIGANKFPPVC